MGRGSPTSVAAAAFSTVAAAIAPLTSVFENDEGGSSQQRWRLWQQDAEAEGEGGANEEKRCEDAEAIEIDVESL